MSIPVQRRAGAEAVREALTAGYAVAVEAELLKGHQRVSRQQLLAWQSFRLRRGLPIDVEDIRWGRAPLLRAMRRSL